MAIQLLDLDALVSDVHELDPLPQSAVRLAGLLADEEWDLEAIREVVRLDAALTGRLLAAANSVRAGSRAEILSVDQAVMRLGAASVLSLAVGAAVRGPLQRSLPALGLDEGALWRHSVASALTVELARKHLPRAVPPHAFATALLHDVGKLVLERHLDESAAAGLRRARTEGHLDEDESEVEILQVSHAEVGALVARAWELPEVIAEGIQHHHHPLSATGEQGRYLAYLVQLGDAVASAIGADCGEVPVAGGLSPDVAGALGLPLQAFHELCERATEDLDGVLDMYGG